MIGGQFLPKQKKAIKNVCLGGFGGCTSVLKVPQGSEAKFSINNRLSVNTCVI